MSESGIIRARNEGLGNRDEKHSRTHGGCLTRTIVRYL